MKATASRVRESHSEARVSWKHTPSTIGPGSGRHVSR